MELFEFAKSKGDFLVVGIDCDERIKKNKGASRPINSEKDRKYFLECIKFIDKVIIFKDDYDLMANISIHHVDSLIVGSDWQGKKVIGSEYAKNIEFFNRIEGYSTTSLLEKL